MLPKTDKQVQLAKKRAGKKTDVKMSEKQMEEFASKPKGKKLPVKTKPKKKK
jgi:hypothetical protein